MNSQKIIKEIRSLDIKNSDNHKRISFLLNILRDADKIKQYKKDLEMMKKIKMEYVGFKI